MTPRESAQAEADQTFNSFIKVSKYTNLDSIINDILRA